jgi:hypothetical protein
MNMLIRWIEDAQRMTIEEKREVVTYTKEAFTQLYEEALKLKGDHKNELKIATGKGIIIGATAVGLGALGLKKINKFKKRNQEDEIEVPIEDLEEMLNARHLDDDNALILDIREVSKANREALKNIIADIGERRH